MGPKLYPQGFSGSLTWAQDHIPSPSTFNPNWIKNNTLILPQLQGYKQTWSQDTLRIRENIKLSPKNNHVPQEAWSRKVRLSFAELQICFSQADALPPKSRRSWFPRLSPLLPPCSALMGLYNSRVFYLMCLLLCARPSPFVLLDSLFALRPAAAPKGSYHPDALALLWGISR